MNKLCYVMLCYVMLYYVVLCCVLLCNVSSCYVMFMLCYGNLGKITKKSFSGLKWKRT